MKIMAKKIRNKNKILITIKMRIKIKIIIAKKMRALLNKTMKCQLMDK